MYTTAFLTHRTGYRWCLPLLIGLLLLIYAPLSAATIIDVTLGGDGDSGPAAISADGNTVAFASFASNLVSPPTATQEIFNFNRLTAATALMSLASGGGAAPGQCLNPAISGDGASTFFETASQLVAEDTDNKQDVYRRSGGATVRISVATGGGPGRPPGPATGASAFARPNTDGSLVTFISSMYGLGGPDTGDNYYGYVRDMTANVTTLVAAVTTMDAVAISPDGAFLAVHTGGTLQIYAYDRGAHACTLVRTYPNVNSVGSLSGPSVVDGAYRVVFQDTLTGNIVWSPIATGATEVIGSGVDPVISADGRFVAYENALLNGLKVHAIGTGVVATFAGIPAELMLPSISGDGRLVAFQSSNATLVPGDTNGACDVFLADLASFQPDLLIANASDGLYAGDNVYNADGAGQAKAQSITTPVTAVYDLKLQNDDPIFADTFKITGGGGGGGWTVRYYDAASGGNEITGAVTGAGWQTSALAAGGELILRVEVTGSKGCRPSPAVADLLVTATSLGAEGGTPPADTVKATTTWTNSAPVAVADGPYTLVAGDLTVTAPGVLGNDTDADGDALTAVKNADPEHGTVEIAADGSFRYSPTPGYFGPDTFQYVASDGLQTSDAITISIAVNGAPIPTNSSLLTSIGVVKLGQLTATDPDGDAITFGIETQGLLGTAVMINPTTGAYSYTPLLTAAPGADSFTFRATDVKGAYAIGTVSVDLRERITTITLTTNATSPGVGGTTVLLTAVAAGGGEVEYAFRVVDVVSGLDVIPQTAFSTENTYLWHVDPAGGSFLLYAYAREARGGTARSATKSFIAIDNSLTDVTLTASPASPLASPGTPVLLTATAFGTAPSYEYKYKITDAAGSTLVQTPFTAGANTYLWTTTGAVGTYTLYAFVRVDSAHYEIVKSIPFAIATPELTKVTLAAGLPSPQVAGTTVTFTATPTPASLAGEVEYQFTAVKNGVTVARQAYSTTATFDWDTTGAAGSYTVQVQARSVAMPTNVKTASVSPYMIVDSALSGVTLTPDKASPQIQGTPVTFTAAAAPPSPPGTVEYQFVVYNALVQVVRQTAFSGNGASWDWDGTLPAGNYSVRVNARLASNPTALVYTTVSFIMLDPLLTSVALAASPTTPSLPPITFTATTTPATGDFEYQFLVRLPDYTLVRATGFTAANTYDWDATVPAGTYRVTVNARPRSLPNYVQTATITYFVKDPGLMDVTLSAAPGNEQALGQIVRLTAAPVPAQPNPPPTPPVVEYQFKMLLNGLTLLTPWQSSPVYDWDTTGLPAGWWTLSANARLAGNPAYVLTSPAKAYLLAEPDLLSIVFSTDKPSGVPVGMPVMLSTVKTPVRVSGQTSVEYLFIIKQGATEIHNTGWSSTQYSYRWDTSGLASGYYMLFAYARPTATHAYTLSASRAFYLAPAILSSVTLTTDRVSPQLGGTTVQLTAVTTPPQPVGSSLLEYQFQLVRGGTTIHTPWSTSPHYTWTTTLANSGVWTLAVYARLTGDTTYSKVSLGKGFILTEPCLQGIVVSTDKPSGSLVGTTVVVSNIKNPAALPGDTDVEYRYLILKQGGAVLVNTAFSSAVTSYTWNTTGLAAGGYLLYVYARPTVSKSYTLSASRAFELK